ncbi:MAG: sugar transferase [Pirellulaceae bacterium]|nr:sugar transferase [Pirellulaceae bacterium]
MRPAAQKHVVRDVEFLNAQNFERLVEKEMCRAERRHLNFCVVLVRFDGISTLAAKSQYHALSEKFRARLRITDEIGSYQNEFAVLLPETLASEAALVANDLVAIGEELGLKLIIEIFAYPDSDGTPVSGNSSQERLDKVSRPADCDRPGSVRLKSQVAKAVVGDGVSHVGAETIKTHRLQIGTPTPFWKRAMDICGSVVGLVLLSPLLIAISIAIKLTSRGPVIFMQWREGKDGELFQIYKFRTMCIDAEKQVSTVREFSEQDGPAFKLKDDPRVTGLGRYLRKCCADELPQLVNVLKGQMSLVGPRPLPVDESYACTPWQRRRLAALPGLTCFWQVEGGREIAFNDWMRMDLAYIRCRSLMTDVKLILKTVIVTVLHKGSV